MGKHLITSTDGATDLLMADTSLPAEVSAQAGTPGASSLHYVRLRITTVSRWPITIRWTIPVRELESEAKDG